MQSEILLPLKLHAFLDIVLGDDTNATLIIQYSRNEEENLDYMRIEMRNHKIIGMSEEWEDYASNLIY
ncbi:MAG: hypothetical protein U5L01_14200 [Rheinheimera sp.]|nr:hypothetical protein [Rheinheimera sp.]